MQKYGIAAAKNVSAERLQGLREATKQRTLDMVRRRGEEHGLAGEPMDAATIERTGESDFSTQFAHEYSSGYVKGRETRGKGRRRKNYKKTRKTRRHARK